MRTWGLVLALAQVNGDKLVSDAELLEGDDRTASAGGHCGKTVSKARTAHAGRQDVL